MEKYQSYWIVVFFFNQVIYGYVETAMVSLLFTRFIICDNKPMIIIIIIIIITLNMSHLYLI